MAASVDSFYFDTPDGHVTCAFSSFSFENCRFSSDGLHTRMHLNEDRVVVTPVVGESQSEKPKSVLFTVLDGHDGSQAADHFQSHFPKYLGARLSKGAVSQGHAKLVEDTFLQEDQMFFDGLKSQIRKRTEITRLLEGLNSYEAYLQYPSEVAELQYLDQETSGGATAAVAGVEVGREGCKVWSANVGNTRVVLCESGEKCEQLSVDHGATNEEELDRLADLGLDKAKILKDGRLGGFENFRCLGDYALKMGYHDVDDMSGAQGPPGIAVPHVSEPRLLNLTEGSPQYLLLMSDGVYQLQEAVSESKDRSAQEVADSVHRAILREVIMFEQDLGADGSTGSVNVAERVVKERADRASKMYMENCKIENPEAQRIAQLFRKLDDMTLIVIKLMFHKSVGTAV